MHFVNQTKGMRKLDPGWGRGLILGSRKETQELVIGAKDVAVRSRDRGSRGSDAEVELWRR